MQLTIILLIILLALAWLVRHCWRQGRSPGCCGGGGNGCSCTTKSPSRDAKGRHKTACEHLSAEDRPPNASQ
jgi:hypothetical protein